MLSHNCLMANVQFFIDNLPVENDSRVVSFLPLAHCFGCAFDFLSPFVKGCHITFLGKIPSPKIILKAFEEIKPVIIFAVPLILEKIYRAKIMPVLESAKMKILMKIPGLKNLIIKKIGRSINEAFGGNHYEIIVGGAAFNPEIEEFFMKAGVRVTVGYGMTECGPLISYRDYYKGRPVGSCGKVINYLDIKIDSPDEHGIGEICVKGENIMDGYYKMDEQTAEAIDSEGWLHTGDLAYIDSEGFIFISGRSKNMILSSSGQNIYPEEIEAKINFMAYVAESLVLDSGNGKLVAYVYPDKEKMSANNITEEMVAEIMKENRVKLNEVLPLFAKVTDIRLYPEEFEKTSTKKIKRRLYTSLVK
ncbi:MAG TPA: AMP-binding protein, partial [bacterium]|nr:AMP-binding protein [bacterium]